MCKVVVNTTPLIALSHVGQFKPGADRFIENDRY